MAGFFDRMLGRSSNEKKGSGAIAKDRLKMVLTHDRIQVSPEKLKEMRGEIIAVISKYVPEIDPDSVDISIEQTDRYNNRIVAHIPFTKSRMTPAVVEGDNEDRYSPLSDEKPLSETAENIDDSSDTLSEPANSDEEETVPTTPFMIRNRIDPGNDFPEAKNESSPDPVQLPKKDDDSKPGE